jgi:HlyD family secretion protein
MSAESHPPDAALSAIVAEGSPDGRRRRTWRRLVAVAVAAGAVVALVLARSGNSADSPRFRAEETRAGDLTVTVSATGNLQPTNQVDVGSEVSGLVETVLVDDNDRVRTGQVLARLDISRLQDMVINSRAALTSAEAKVVQAEATVKETQANLTRLRQAEELSGGTIVARADLETAEAAAARAVADLSSARAAVEQARASLSSAETNLSKASIRSPIDGIVLARQIEPGQTVAASFQAPVLFTLAEDLSKMELEVDVDEADVGDVRTGQPAVFTVDAYPGRRYPARITRVNYGSQTKDGVVSYQTTLSVDNADLTLRPGMTATADITTVERKDVLLVPNAALRYTPPTAAVPQPREGGIVSRLLPRPPRPSVRAANGNHNGRSGQTVWVLRDGQPVAVPVTVGSTDGRFTEVTGGELEAGTPVVTETIGSSS